MNQFAKPEHKARLIDRMTAPVWFCCVVLAGFTNWFALGNWLRASVVANLVLVVVVLLSFIYKKQLIPEKLLHSTLIFIFFVFLSAFINFYDFNHKSVNHLIAMVFIVFFMFFLPATALYRNSSDYLLHIVGSAFVFSAFLYPLVIFLDFILVNFFSIRLADLFVFANVGNADYFIWSGVFSVAGPAEEPAISAYYSQLFFFGALAYCTIFNVRRYTILLYVGQVIALIATMSSTAILVFMLFCLFKTLFFRKIFFLKYFVILFAVSVGVLFSNEILAILNVFSFVDKITLNDDSISVGLRTHSWILFFDAIRNSVFFGVAPGFNNILVGTGVHSTFFTIIINYGVICLGSFLYFLYIIYRRFCVVDFRVVFFVMLIPHFIADYYFSFLFWLVLGYVYCLSFWHVNSRGLM